jgi:hypothetical protein
MLFLNWAMMGSVWQEGRGRKLTGQGVYVCQGVYFLEARLHSNMDERLQAKLAFMGS